MFKPTCVFFFIFSNLPFIVCMLCLCVHICGDQRTTSDDDPYLSLALRNESLIHCCEHQVSWSIDLCGFSCLGFPSWRSESKDMHYNAYVNSGDLNPGSLLAQQVIFGSPSQAPSPKSVSCIQYGVRYSSPWPYGGLKVFEPLLRSWWWCLWVMYGTFRSGACLEEVFTGSWVLRVSSIDWLYFWFSVYILCVDRNVISRLPTLLPRSFPDC